MKQHPYPSFANKPLAALLLTATIWLIPAANWSEDKFDFVVAKDVVKNILKEFKSYNTYQADFKIISKKGKKTKVRQGTIYFRKPDKVRMDFSRPRRQSVVSDGETVWIYVPRLKLLGKQELKSEGDEGFFSKKIPIGLERLFSLYHYSFTKKKQPSQASVAGQKGKYYTLSLKQTVMTSGFREMTLWVNQNYRIQQVKARTALGKDVTMSFAKIKTGIDLKESLFVFNKEKYPVRNTVKNPLVQP
jgi:outer membrane lipoprotein-sorting protein